MGTDVHLLLYPTRLFLECLMFHTKVVEKNKADV
jgi:hypothetical protein